MPPSAPVDRSSLRNLGWMMLVLVIALSLPASRLAMHVWRCRLIDEWAGSVLLTTPIGPEWVSDVIGARAKYVMRRPVSVYLRIVNEDPHEIDRLVDAVANLETLTEVFFEGWVTDELLLKLRPLNSLTKLRLHSGRVTANGLSVLDSMPALRLLDLSGSKAVDDRALVAISGATELEELSLCDTAVTDTGLPQLTTLRKLRLLDLSYTAIHDDGLMALEGLRSLERLDVSATSVTDEGIAALRAALPHLEIIDD